MLDKNRCDQESHDNSILSISDMLLINKGKNIVQDLQEFHYDYVERRPIMIASSAYISDSIRQKCIAIGFDYITDIPFKQDFLKRII